MTRAILGILLVLHGLAHTSLGIWAADIGPDYVVTPLWLGASAGYIAAGFGELGVALVRNHWRRLTAVGAASSLLLLAVYGQAAFALGLLVNLLLLAGAVRWVPLHDGERGRAGAGSADVSVSEGSAWRATGHMLALGFLAYLSAVVLLRPWYATWGTTAAERFADLSGDDLVPQAHYRIDHTITIHAPASAVWPWVAQIGQDRAGFYSYTWLENLIGAEIHNADQIVPAWQHPQVGDLVRAVPPDWLGGRFGRDIGWRIERIEPGRALVLAGWGAFVVQPLDDRTSRLHARLRGEGAPSLVGTALAPAGLLIFEPAHFVMQRGMLLGIKARAERGQE